MGRREFYRARAAISKRLIERARLQHRRARGRLAGRRRPSTATSRHRPQREGEHAPFERFPTWMWRNAEVDAFVRWLRGHNHGRAATSSMAGFFGLDLYNLHGSMRAVIDYPREGGSRRPRRWRASATAASSPGQTIPPTYGRMAVFEAMRAARSRSSRCCATCWPRNLELPAGGRRRVAGRRRERPPRQESPRPITGSCTTARAESWNLRDTHMFETLKQLLDAQGPRLEGGRLGAQQPHRRRRAHRDGPDARRAEPRPAVQGAVRRCARA